MSADIKLFDPKLLSQEHFDVVLGVIKNTPMDDPNRRVKEFLNFCDIDKAKNSEQCQLAVTCSLLADLTDQGWGISIRNSKIYIQAPSTNYHKGETILDAKARFRESLYRSSNRQIAETSVELFLKNMEKAREFKAQTVSILSLLEKGAEFSDLLKKTSSLSDIDAVKSLSDSIQPIIQVCGPGDKCIKTGLKLLDVWRYFRYTWSLEYNSVPGRTLRILIRNKAKKNWPIIGIAMIASPAANMYSRDSWIGWRTEDLIQKIVSKEWNAGQTAKSLLSVLREAISNIRTDDLISDSEIENPTLNTYFKLSQTIDRATRERATDLESQNEGVNKLDRLIDIRDYKSKDFKTFNDTEWKLLSGTSLFVKKRAEQLLPLLKTLEYFKAADLETDPASGLMEILVSPQGKKHVTFALNEIRKLRLASEIADISVCGAIAPYNNILGGKLVTLLMSSQEVRDIYKTRYSNQPSEIASQIAGRKLIRNSELKVVTTTSLYGVGSSQYNRLKLSSNKHSDLKHDIKWEELKMSEGFSVTHVSARTVRLMRALALIEHGHRKINSVFGEGSSPRTRQIRIGLNLIGIYDESPLTHAVGRKVYACELYPGARRTLIGLTGNSRKLRSNSAKTITRAWLERWVVNRIKREETLSAISKFTPDEIPTKFKERIQSVRMENEEIFEI